MKNHNLALFTDFYELTMTQGFFFTNKDQQAVFNMFFRRPPFKSGFSVFAGLSPLLDYIVNLRFTKDEIDYLYSLKTFQDEYLDYLSEFEFKGDVYAVDEGSIVFPNEPLIRVHGSLIEAQLLEGLILNTINFQTLIATKTARSYIETKGRAILEFGLRRAQGLNGAITASRAAYIGGAVATSNTFAGKYLGIPVKGTMAHSWIMSFPTELESFEKYAELYPNNCILLVDTFDTIKSGIPNAIKVLKKLKEKNMSNYGIRLDSGDLEYLSKEARKLLDDAGLEEAKIVISNDLDEYIINQLIAKGLPIDAFGIGTRLVTGGDDPALTGVYKIVAKTSKEDNFEPVIKISNNPEKISDPGISNIVRFYDDEQMLADLIYLDDGKDNELLKKVEQKEQIKLYHPSIDYSQFNICNYKSAEILLKPVIKQGKKVIQEKSLSELQNQMKAGLEKLHHTHTRLLNPHLYKVSHSENLKKLKKELILKHSNF